MPDYLRIGNAMRQKPVDWIAELTAPPDFRRPASLGSDYPLKTIITP